MRSPADPFCVFPFHVYAIHGMGIHYLASLLCARALRWTNFRAAKRHAGMQYRIYMGI